MSRFVVVTAMLLIGQANAEVIKGTVIDSRVLGSHADAKDPNISVGTRQLTIKAEDGSTQTVIHRYTLVNKLAVSDYSFSQVRNVHVRDATEPALIKNNDVLEITVEKTAAGIWKSTAGVEIKLLERPSQSTAGYAPTRMPTPGSVVTPGATVPAPGVNSPTVRPTIRGPAPRSTL